MDAVDAHLQRYPDSPVARDVLGTTDPDAIRALAHEHDPEAGEIFFFALSVGALFGIRRTDGTRVAMKLHKLNADPEYLDGMQAVQRALADSGLPAPRPLGRRGATTWEEWLEEGAFRDAHEPDVRVAMARELARFHRVATAVGVTLRRPFFPEGEGALWPKPHNALFDFGATARGAEWIDEIARAAKVLRDSDAGNEVVGHTDWSAKHLRFDESLRLTAVYDWDSLDTQREPALVGNAAGSFTYTEELDHPVVLWPTAAESLAFIADYEQARGASFTPAERAGARGACVYLRAYAARCTHAYSGDATHVGLEETAAALL